MQADWSSLAADFSEGLLRPELPVPAGASVATPKRYAVYRNNVTVGLVEALEANFPALRRLLGGEEFLRVALAHARQHPPQSKLLFEYGQHLPAQLERDPALAGFPYLADVARLERLWLDSFHEADAPPLVAEDLAAIPETELPGIRLKLHPAARLFASHYAAVSILAASRAGSGLDGIGLGQGEFGLVTRPRLAVDVRRIGEGDYSGFARLASGATLADAVELAATAESEFEPARFISLIIESGAFSRVIRGTEP